MEDVVKLRDSNTTLKLCDQIVNTPFLDMSDSRLLPETV
ncbi:OprD family outer membrane porin [Pseudomonas sp. WHRI 8519]